MLLWLGRKKARGTARPAKGNEFGNERGRPSGLADEQLTASMEEHDTYTVDCIPMRLTSIGPPRTSDVIVCSSERDADNTVGSWTRSSSERARHRDNAGAARYITSSWCPWFAQCEGQYSNEMACTHPREATETQDCGGATWSWSKPGESCLVLIGPQGVIHCHRGHRSSPADLHVLLFLQRSSARSACKRFSGRILSGLRYMWRYLLQH